HPCAVLLAADQLERDGASLIGGQPLLGERHQFAVDPGPEDIARLDVQVGGAALHGGLDDLFHAPSGSSGGRGASRAAAPGTPCAPAPRARARTPGAGPWPRRRPAPARRAPDPAANSGPARGSAPGSGSCCPPAPACNRDRPTSRLRTDSVLLTHTP